MGAIKGWKRAQGSHTIAFDSWISILTEATVSVERYSAHEMFVVARNIYGSEIWHSPSVDNDDYNDAKQMAITWMRQHPNGGNSADRRRLN